jgi:hypothetical protein
VSLVAWFCPPAHDGLRSRHARVFSAAISKLYSVFTETQEYGLGRLARSGAEITFQKKHAAALSRFARHLIAITLRVPSWPFGAHPPDNIKRADESQLAVPVESVAGATPDMSNGVVPASGALPDNTSAASPVDCTGGASGAGVAANTAGKLALGAGTAMAAADGLHKSRKKKLNDAAADGAQPLQDEP